MKSIIYIGMALVASACAKTTLRTGDLLFQFGDDKMSEAIAESTGNFTHAAIALRRNGRLEALEATSEGVKITPWEEFSCRPTVGKRIRLSRKLRKQAVEKALQRLGAPYDYAFQPDNGAYYCTELIEESYLDAHGNRIFKRKPMTFKNRHGETPAYWVEHFAARGEPIPEGVPGTNPSEMSRAPILRGR